MGLKMGEPSDIPKLMKAIQYNKIKDFSLVTKPVPSPKAHEALIKGAQSKPITCKVLLLINVDGITVKSCGICGTDLHIHNGDFAAKMPVVTGHETSGIVVAVGDAVQNLRIGDKVTADNAELCGHCYHCQRGELLFCENFAAHGVHRRSMTIQSYCPASFMQGSWLTFMMQSIVDGGLAEYCVFPAEKLFPFTELSWTDASLFEAASCAVHGLDRVAPKVGSTILMIGAGPTGLCLAQLLKLNGGSHLVLAANAGPKMELAKKLHCADEYIDLDRQKPAAQWMALKESYPHGFDIVVEASGSPQVLEKAVDFCARGGKLLYYGVYPKDARIEVSPSLVFSNEINILG